MGQLRRNPTDGRDWPRNLEPSYLGTSIGHWEDADAAGRFRTLVVETRGLKGPRTFDGSIPLHQDNETIVKERISADKADANVLHNEITTLDHALTRPRTVTRKATGAPARRSGSSIHAARTTSTSSSARRITT